MSPGPRCALWGASSAPPFVVDVESTRRTDPRSSQRARTRQCACSTSRRCRRRRFAPSQSCSTRLLVLMRSAPAGCATRRADQVCQVLRDERARDAGCVGSSSLLLVSRADLFPLCTVTGSWDKVRLTHRECVCSLLTCFGSADAQVLGPANAQPGCDGAASRTVLR